MADVVYGLTDQGFVMKRLADCQSDLEASAQSVFGVGINLLPGSNFSNFIGLVAGELSDLWELAADVYNAAYPTTANGVNLDNVQSIVRVKRLTAAKTIQQNLILFGDVGAIIPVGTLVGVVGNSTIQFMTQSEVTLGVGVNEVQRISFSAVPTSGSWTLQFYDQVTTALAYNCLASDVQAALNAIPQLVGCTVTGSFSTGFNVTFGGQAGAIDQALLSYNSDTLMANSALVTLSFTTTTQGVPQGVTDAIASDYGPVVAPAYSMTNIINPVTGLSRVLNTVDAVVGRLDETDAAYRLRALIDQQSSGKATVNAIRANLLTLTGVTQVTVFENTSDTTDSNGLPPHSFRCYVQGGTASDIFESIWENKPSGIYPDGTITGTIIDSQGVTQPVRYSLPQVIDVYIAINITRDTTQFPIDGVTQVQNALAAYVNGLSIGDDVILYPKLISTLNNIPGILNISLNVGTSPNPTGTSNIIVGIQQVAKVLNPATDILVTLS